MEREESVVTVPVIWRGKKFTVEINSGVYLKDFGDDLMKLTDVKADTMRLIVPQVSSDGPKLLMPFSDEHSCLRLRDTSIIGAKSIRMMGVSEDEIDQVMKGAKVDLRIAGFEEEERRMRQRITNRPTAPKLPQGPYVFCDFRTLELPGVQLNPPASEALKRMHMLAADPGIVAIMNKHRWRVGIMTEMAPVGYVGISPKCLLGFNKNQGEEISLRLRTDDLKGFRKYEVIKKTLLHELAHMIHTEHDENFYALDRQLNQEASTLDWTRSAGRRLTGVRPSENDDMDVDFKSEIVSSHRLGGQATNLLLNARAASIAAAYHRLTDASTSPVLSKRNKESSPIEWPGCGLHSEAQAVDAMRGKGADFQNQNGDMNEPDPVNNSGKQVKQEPDPDDSKPAAEIDHGPCFASEPDPDDMETTQSQPILAANIRMDSTKVHREPNPDDLEVAGAAVESSFIESVSVHSDSSKSTMRPANEPDPHDMEEKSNHQDNMAVCDLSGCLDSDFIADQRLHSSILIESDLDDSVRSKQFEPHLLVNKVCVEPDPDDSKTRKAVALEPDVDDNLKHLPVGLDEPDPDDEELQRIQDPVTKFCSQLTRAIKLLCNEVHPTQAECVLQTLVKIIRNVIENPNEIKYKRLRNANPVFRRNIANYKAAVDILVLVGYQENVLLDESGKADTYLVLKRNDPGLLWLAKSFLETSMTHIMK